MSPMRPLMTVLIASLPTCFPALAQSGNLPCPVTITKLESSGNAKVGLLAALADAGSSSTWLTIGYQNNSQRIITGISFSVSYMNSVGEVSATNNVTTPTIHLKPTKSFRIIEADGDITNGNQMQTTGKVAKVAFSDGQFWTNTGTQTCVDLLPSKKKK
jgi:hypothetical protein